MYLLATCMSSLKPLLPVQPLMLKVIIDDTPGLVPTTFMFSIVVLDLPSCLSSTLFLPFVVLIDHLLRFYFLSFLSISVILLFYFFEWLICLRFAVYMCN